MSAANLDEIKKKYNFKEISVATWRDPSLSVHPVRGGPDSPRFSPDAFYVPRLKDSYDYDSDSETDDEQSIVSEGEIDHGDRGEMSSDLGLEEPLVDLPEPEQRPDTSSEEQVAQDREPEIEIQSHEPEEPETGSQPPEFEETDEQGLNPPDIDLEPDMAKEDSPNENDPAINMPEGGDQPTEPAGADPIDVEPFGEGADGDAAPPSDTGSDERRVSFAPGTPDPKPTPRKKKAATGTKKKKKRIAVPIDSLPADVMAMIDGAFEGLPPPPPPPPAPEAPLEDDFVLDNGAKDLEETDHTVNQDAPLLEEPAVEDAPLAASADEPTITEEEDLPVKTPAEPPQEDTPAIPETEQAPETPVPPAAPEAAPVDASAIEPIEEAPVELEKPTKKKSSKSGKDKEKSKKKSSKTKSRDISPPPLGLGIDLLPPPPPPPPPPVIEDVVDDGEIPASADQGEIATEVLPAEDLETTADAGPENEHQDTSAAEGVPDPTVDDPPATDATSTEHSGGSKEEADGSHQDSSQHNRITEPDSTSEQEAEVGVVPDAWDAEEIVAEFTVAPTDAKAEPAGEESAPAESAPSPVDSGVEFEDDGAKPADEQIDAGASVPIEESAKKSEVVADNEAANASALAVESGEKEEQAAEPDPAAEAPDAVGDSPSSEAVEPEGEGAQQDSGEAAVKEAGDAPEAPTSTDPEALETSKEDTNVDESSTEPSAESSPEEASKEESTENADPEEAPVEAAEGELDAKPIIEDKALPTEDVAAEGETEGYEPPTVESVSEEAKVNPFEFEVVAEPEGTAGPGLEQETAREVESSPEAPPSPVLSKSDSQGSHKHKADHWARKHADNPLKEVFEDAKVLERTHGSKSGKDELRVRDRHRKSRRMSSSGEDDVERRRRRAARKEAEKKEAEAARLTEELRRRDEEERKYQERRAAKQRAAEESAAQKDVEIRPRHRERDVERSEGRSARPLKATLPFALPAIPKALNLTSGQSVHSASVIRSHGGAYKPAAKEVARQAAPTSAPRDEAEPKASSRDAKTASPPSSGGEKSPHRHRHRRHRSDGDRSSRNGKESDRHHRRPVLVEERVEARPRSFLGFVKI